MKKIITLSLLSFTLSAYAFKPELILRYSYVDNWRLPQGELCFNTTPAIYHDNIFLRCTGEEKEKLYKISNDQVTEVYTSKAGHKLTDPVLGLKGPIWAEYSEGGTRGTFEYLNNQVSPIEFTPQGMVDGLAQIDEGKYVFRWRTFDGEQQISLWNNIAEIWTDHPDRSFAFTPSGVQGQLAYKLRLNTLSENSPDMIYWWKDLNHSPLKVVDLDTDSNSQWKSFRNTVSLSGTSMVFTGKLKSGEDAVAMMNLAGQVEILAKTGFSDVSEIDFFTPVVNKSQNVLFRGTDKSGKKALFLWQKGKLTKVLRQGDVVHSDKGIARIDYQEKDAVFMSAPTLGEDRLLIQTALVDLTDPKTLIGVGLIQLKLENASR